MRKIFLTWYLQFGYLNSGNQVFYIVFQCHKSDFSEPRIVTAVMRLKWKMIQEYIVTIHHLGHSCIQSKDSFHFLTSLEVCYECPTRENFSNWTERENFFILSWNFDVFTSFCKLENFCNNLFSVFKCWKCARLMNFFDMTEISF